MESELIVGVDLEAIEGAETDLQGALDQRLAGPECRDLLAPSARLDH